jgi:hypothetical protein
LACGSDGAALEEKGLGVGTGVVIRELLQPQVDDVAHVLDGY